MVSLRRSHCHSASETFMIKPCCLTFSITLRRVSSSWPRISAARRSSSAVPVLGEVAHRVDAAEVLATIGFDDHGRVQARGLFRVPQEELLAIALERDFDQLRGHRVRLLGILPHGEELLAPPPHEFLGPIAA